MFAWASCGALGHPYLLESRRVGLKTLKILFLCDLGHRRFFSYTACDIDPPCAGRGSPNRRAGALHILIAASALWAHVRGAAGGCNAFGVATGSDNAGDCAALVAAYNAMGNQPAAWSLGIASGSSYCVWCNSTNLPAAYNFWLACDGNGRVQTLCASPPKRWLFPPYAPTALVNVRAGALIPRPPAG